MTNYKIFTITSTIAFILSGFCLALFIVSAMEWGMDTTIISAICSVCFGFFGISEHKSGVNAYKYYLSKQEEVRDIYSELSHMHKKYYWALNVDSIIPSYKDKHSLLAWAADIAVVCQAYRHDYKTEELDPNTDRDLSIMIGLAQDLIEFKKYL